MAAATTPKVASPADEEVRYRTYVRDPDADRLSPRLVEFHGAFAAIPSAFASTSLTGRAFERRSNPYLVVNPPADRVTVAPNGASIVASAVDAADLLKMSAITDGNSLLAAFGALSASEAAVSAEAVKAVGVPATRMTVRN